MSEEENIEEQPTDNLQQSTENNDSISEPSTINEPPSIENMEVHHHPDLHHKPKKRKEYFLEFLMIFLAVTMGFFAENLREHFKDSNEIKNNIQSIVTDLHSDVTMYNKVMQENQLSDRRIDTMISLLKTGRSNTSEIYFLARYSTANNDVYTPNTRTFDLMKSSGTLKLIEPRRLLDSISDYYQGLQILTPQSALQAQKITDVHVVNNQLFDGSVFQQMFTRSHSNNATETHIEKPGNNPPLLSNDFAIINKIIIAYHYLYATTEINNAFAENNCKQARHLIEIIKKEYHLENE